MRTEGEILKELDDMDAQIIHVNGPARTSIFKDAAALIRDRKAAVETCLTAKGQDLCHENREALARAHGLTEFQRTPDPMCDVHVFGAGCREHQVSLFGRSPDAEVRSAAERVCHIFLHDTPGPAKVQKITAAIGVLDDTLVRPSYPGRTPTQSHAPFDVPPEGASDVLGDIDRDCRRMQNRGGQDLRARVSVGEMLWIVPLADRALRGKVTVA